MTELEAVLIDLLLGVIDYAEGNVPASPCNPRPRRRHRKERTDGNETPGETPAPGDVHAEEPTPAPPA